MRKMASSLKLPLTEVEEIVASLISKGSMHARIDSESKIIHSRETDERYDTIQKVIQLTNQHKKEICKGILRLSLSKNGLSVSIGDKNASQSQYINEEESHFDSNSIDDSNDNTFRDV